MNARLAVTVFCLLLFLSGLWLPLPLVHGDALRELSASWSGLFGFALFPGSRVSWFTVGVTPFVIGFLIVELISLTTPQGLRLRRDGVAGRRKLNLAALGLSAAIVPAQAWVTARFLAEATTPSGASLTSAPTWILFATLTAATFVAAALAETISRYGLGNGFALLFVAEGIPTLVVTVRRLVVSPPGGEPETGLMSLIWSGLLVALLVAYLGRRPEARLSTPEGGLLTYRLPPLPQGALPLTWSYALLNQLTWPSLLSEWPLLRLSDLAYYGLLAAGTLLMSALAAWMFTARRRVESNLSGLVAVPAEPYDRLWRRQLVLGVLVLAIGEAGLAALPTLLPTLDTVVLPLSLLLPPLVVVLDLVDTARLAARTPLERVLTLDNVHLAELLRARLAEEGIDSVVTCFRFRRLSYFFGALFKMGLLVPAEDRERAERLVDETPFRIV